MDLYRKEKTEAQRLEELQNKARICRLPIAELIEMLFLEAMQFVKLISKAGEI